MEGSQNKKWGADRYIDRYIDNVDVYSASSLISPDAPYRKNFYLQIPTSVPNFNFIARFISEI